MGAEQLCARSVGAARLIGATQSLSSRQRDWPRDWPILSAVWLAGLRSYPRSHLLNASAFDHDCRATIVGGPNEFFLVLGRAKGVWFSYRLAWRKHIGTGALPKHTRPHSICFAERHHLAIALPVTSPHCSLRRRFSDSQTAFFASAA